MKELRHSIIIFALFSLLACSAAIVSTATAQDAPVILTGAQLTRVVPPGFYFEGQSAPTQIRNAAAARIGSNRHIIAGMVDTSGYSADIRAKYEGFFITDSPLTIGGRELGVGAYGFGFTDDGKLNLFDVSGKQLLSVDTTQDKNLRRPRPLTMVKASDGVRFYSGKNYAVIAAR